MINGIVRMISGSRQVALFRQIRPLYLTLQLSTSPVTITTEFLQECDVRKQTATRPT